MKQGKFMKYQAISLLLVGALSGVTLPVLAQDSAVDAEPGVAVSVRLSTLGYGAELDYPLNANWNLRLQANSFNYNDTFDESDIEYEGDLELSTQGLLVDFRPFAGTFKLTAGIFSNSNQLVASAYSNSDKSFEIGGQRYSGAANNPLRLAAEVELGKSSAGYLGLGWGHSYQSGVSFSVELGALLSGAATAKLTASGSAYRTDLPQQQFDVQGNTAAAQLFQQRLAAEQTELQDDLDGFELYPVVGLSLGYRF
jgi:hypothetical protein